MIDNQRPHGHRKNENQKVDQIYQRRAEYSSCCYETNKGRIAKVKRDDVGTFADLFVDGSGIRRSENRGF